MSTMTRVSGQRPLVTRSARAVREAFESLARAPKADLASALLLGAVCLVMLLTLSDYGLTYDEEPHIRYGERVLEFYTGGLEGRRAMLRSSYGAGFDLAAALLRRVSPWDEFQTNHFLCVFVAQLGLLGTWRLGRLVAGPAGGLLSLMFLVLTPVYYGHQFNNPKDIPFAAGYVWGLYFIARVLQAASAPSPRADPGGWRFWVSASIALALGMSVRVGGAILLAYLALFLVLEALDAWRTRGFAALARLRPLALGSVLSMLGAWALMVAFWPRALLSPIAGPAAALESVSNYTVYDSPTLLAGETISSNHVPWSYIPTYFLVQLPELLLACFVLGLSLLCLQTWRWLSRREPVLWVWWLLAVAVLLPPGYAIVRGSTLYNGLRHFLFIIPPLAVFAASAVSVLLGQVRRRGRSFRLGISALLALYAADQAQASWRLHPYQHVFFNRASGGLARAVGRYETEYYGSVYQELNERLREQLWETRRDAYLNTTFRVSGCGSKLFFSRNLPPNFEFRAMRRAQRSDFYVTYVRDDCLSRFRDRAPVVKVEREGTTLGIARDMKQKTRRKAAAAPRSKP